MSLGDSVAEFLHLKPKPINQTLDQAASDEAARISAANARRNLFGSNLILNEKGPAVPAATKGYVGETNPRGVKSTISGSIGSGPQTRDPGTT